MFDLDERLMLMNFVLEDYRDFKIPQLTSTVKRPTHCPPAGAPAPATRARPHRRFPRSRAFGSKLKSVTSSSQPSRATWLIKTLCICGTSANGRADGSQAPAAGELANGFDSGGYDGVTPYLLWERRSSDTRAAIGSRRVRTKLCRSELPANDVMRRFNAPRPYLLLRRFPILHHFDASVTNLSAAEFRALNCTCLEGKLSCRFRTSLSQWVDRSARLDDATVQFVRDPSSDARKSQNQYLDAMSIRVYAEFLVRLYTIPADPADVALPFLVDVNLKPGFAFDSDPSHNFDSDYNSTFVFDPSSVLIFSPAFNCDPVLVFDSIFRPAFNSDSAIYHSSDLDEAKSKQFLHILHFDPNYILDSDAYHRLNFDPVLFSISDPILALDVFNFDTAPSMS
ncbi:hypothetical protein EVAR_49309_1 [Eumeta japonica]|uniref:Uncharacterized protein n=1 Tax=Eumeta variegata TaxID=151549 RepID=A0A4C1Y856_EUMVA|nr:hypothetical protein EVAR_49309_1 [Eumeta japonica]